MLETQRERERQTERERESKMSSWRFFVCKAATGHLNFMEKRTCPPFHLDVFENYVYLYAIIFWQLAGRARWYKYNSYLCFWFATLSLPWWQAHPEWCLCGARKSAQRDQHFFPTTGDNSRNSTYKNHHLLILQIYNIQDGATKIAKLVVLW